MVKQRIDLEGLSHFFHQFLSEHLTCTIKGLPLLSFLFVLFFVFLRAGNLNKPVYHWVNKAQNTWAQCAELVGAN